MKITLLEPLGISDSLLNKLIQRVISLGHEFIAYDTRPNSEEEIVIRAKDSEIIMITNLPLSEQVIMALPKLKLINVAFTGTDHIAKDICQKNQIKIANASGYSNVSVSELVLGLTLGLYRQLAYHDHLTRSLEVAKIPNGFEIFGKTVGIIGTGQIGVQTAKLFQAFNAKVIAFSRSKQQIMETLGINYVDLDELLETSDIISLHIPATENTKHFIDEERLKKMKSNAILINCARGSVVDNQALANALKNGIIAGAGIDVFDLEPPLSADDPLLDVPNTLVTPHIAYATHESMERRAVIVFDNLISYLDGKSKNIVSE